jgi:large subunit ribosomal protein L35
MPSQKMKTHKGVKKRFKVSATGKVSHKPCGSSHLNSHKSGKKIRRLRRKRYLSVNAEAQRLRRSIQARHEAVPAEGVGAIPQLHESSEADADAAGATAPTPA